MLIEPTILLWADLVVAGVLGAIGTPILVYVLGQNADRKKEIAASFKNVSDRRDEDQRHFNDAMGELRDRTTVLQTTVNIKKETVDGVQRQQISDGLKMATLEANVTTIRESQKRTEDQQLVIIGKLDSLARIEENVASLKEDMREVRAEQSKQSE